MSNFIPFVRDEKNSYKLAKLYFDAAGLFRVTADQAPGILKHEDGLRLWIDPGVDGLDSPNALKPPTDEDGRELERTPWQKYVQKFQHHEVIADGGFQKTPDKTRIALFVTQVLDHASAFGPSWITVPQLCQGKGAERNKINRLLAEAAGTWKATSKYAVRMIFPMLLRSSTQYSGRTQRKPRIENMKKNYAASGAEGIWIVDGGLDDGHGVDVMKEHYLSLIGLHEEANGSMSPQTRIAGPYWGANLLLWAKGLIDYPAIGLGNSYQYFLSGARPGGKIPTRVSLNHLRRRVVKSPELQKWLSEAIRKLGNHPGVKTFEQLSKEFNRLEGFEAGKFVSAFYQKWVNLLDQTEPAGRALAFFQDLSAAYALGKLLPPLPKTEKAAKRPEAVAEPLMVTCL